MATSHLFRIGRIKGQSGLLEALEHNKRTLQVEKGSFKHIDPEKSSLNYSLTEEKTPKEINIIASILMLEADVKVRKNQVMAIEIIFSLPAIRHSQDNNPFFYDCFSWVKKHIPGHLLSFDVHLDESAPHAHALVLPLVEGKMQGQKIIGNRGNLYRLINLFHKEIGINYGLSSTPKKRLSAVARKSLIRVILSELQSDPIMKSQIWPCVRDAIQADPEPFAQILSIGRSAAIRKNEKSFAQIAISKGKGSSINAI